MFSRSSASSKNTHIHNSSLRSKTSRFRVCSDVKLFLKPNQCYNLKIMCELLIWHQSNCVIIEIFLANYQYNIDLFYLNSPNKIEIINSTIITSTKQRYIRIDVFDVYAYILIIIISIMTDKLTNDLTYSTYKNHFTVWKRTHVNGEKNIS